MKIVPAKAVDPKAALICGNSGKLVTSAPSPSEEGTKIQSAPNGIEMKGGAAAIIRRYRQLKKENRERDK